MNRLMVAALTLSMLGAAACDDDPTGPDGERFTATLTGSTAATGNAVVTWDEDSELFTYTLTVRNITAVVGAHIHGPAAAGENAGVIVPFITPASAPGAGASSTVSNTFPGTNTTTISPDSLLSLLRNGNVYVNVHTSANPGGEIRGQLGPG